MEKDIRRLADYEQYHAMTDQRIEGILEMNGHGLSNTHDVFDLCVEVVKLREEVRKRDEMLDRMA